MGGLTEPTAANDGVQGLLNSPDVAESLARIKAGLAAASTTDTYLHPWDEFAGWVHYTLSTGPQGGRPWLEAVDAMEIKLNGLAGVNYRAANVILHGMGDEEILRLWVRWKLEHGEQ